ncbi:Protein YigP (COG3165) clustered with ubiquinone biosynthetic genes [Pseudoalteromonas luteoviolacea B = ATCC 29581]|nr:Protein YigP (COG3165) clustered with ubiquinone biosynthetic genes [Pseudoalteromonas luteoviolacea B = ATCC 29581]
MLPTFLGALVEQALNQIVCLSPKLRHALAPLKLKTLVIHIRDWQQQIGLVYSGKHFHLFLNYQEKGDCWVSADFNTLTSLQDPSRLTQLIRQNKLDLEGDIHLAQGFSNAFSELEIDWAEHISTYLGDAPAQQLIDSLNATSIRAKHHAQTLSAMASQLCQDELRITIHPLELSQFTAHTRELTHRVNSLEQRINALLNIKE